MKRDRIKSSKSAITDIYCFITTCWNCECSRWWIQTMLDFAIQVHNVWEFKNGYK